jgi:hypothetical protein
MSQASTTAHENHSVQSHNLLLLTCRPELCELRQCVPLLRCDGDLKLSWIPRRRESVLEAGWKQWKVRGLCETGSVDMDIG